MSLINRMLSDLEARKGGSLSNVDSALDGLHPASSLRLAVGERPRLVFGMLILGAAFAALWTSRAPLLDALQRPVVTPQIRSAPLRPPALESAAAPASGAIATAPAATSIVVLEPPPAEALAPEVFAVTLPGTEPAPPLNPAVPDVAPELVREVPADLAPAYLEPETVAPATPASVAAPASPHALPPIEEPRIDEAKLAPAVVEYPGAFHRERSQAPPVSPAARRLAEIEAYFANGSRDVALGRLRELVLADPTQEAARERLALELVADSRVTEAEALLRAGLRLRPDSTRLAQPLGHLLLAQGKPETALAVLRAATPPLAGHSDFHALLAAAEQRTGAHGLAITRFRGLLKEQPLNGSWLVSLAISLLAVDERADAAATFARALDDRALPEPLRVYASREMVRLRDRAR